MFIEVFPSYFVAPTGSPQNLVSNQVTSTTMELSWEPPLPSTHNGVIDSYIVIVFEITTNLVVQSHQNVVSTSITLTGLHPAYDYMLSVAAFTVDLGPDSSITVTTKEACEQRPAWYEQNRVLSLFFT